MSKQDDLYFIKSPETGRIKIGRGDTAKRLKACLTGSPDPDLFVMWHCCGRGYDERKVHQAFADERSHGEWFYPSERLVYWIQSGAEISTLPRWETELEHDLPPDVPTRHIKGLLSTMEAMR